jgi:hypothetical protein
MPIATRYRHPGTNPGSYTYTRRAMHTNIVELRQYLLNHGQRDTLIELFDAQLVETQEAVGMSVLGQFRDPDRPDYFVWLRGFTDMPSRHHALAAFYGGPVWARHCDAANATMIDSDDVLLLRPVVPGSALPDLDPTTRTRRAPTGMIIVWVEHVERHDADALERFRGGLLTALEQHGARTIGLYVTETSTNTFTQLPVRPDNVIAWFGATPTHNGAPAWAATQDLAARQHGGHREVHRLAPTARSVLDDTASTRLAR